MPHINRRSKRTRAPSVPTIKQVAARAGVSTATVSRALAGFNSVSEELNERVREAVRALNYHPNRIARNLRIRTTRTIGVVISDIQNPFFTSLLRGIEDVLQAADYMLLLGNSDENMAREQIYLTTLRAEGAAGIIFTPTSDEAADYLQILNVKAPLVAIDRAPRGLLIDTITVANSEGAHTAVRHLISLGHRRIGMIGGPAHLSTAYERLAGYEQALAEANLQVSPDLIQHADFRQAGGYNAMHSLLELHTPPAAVFVANNLMTLGAFQAINERGLRIPTDIAVVGFDDMPWALSLQPPLTAVAQPTYEMGVTAARLLLSRIQEPERSVRQVVLETRLMVRASCGGGQRQFEIGRLP